MNLVMASVLLLAMLAFQPTLIYGVAKKDLATAVHSHNRAGSPKKHFSSSAPAAKLVMAFESGDVLVRSARGTGPDDAGAGAAAAPAATTANNAAGAGAGTGAGNNNNKRQKNNHKKSNRNSTPENASSTNAGRKHLDKKFSATAANQQQQQQQQQHHGNGNGKQRQLVKSQPHQGHGKRAGGKVKSETSVEKSTDAEKTQSTCRYAKSAWSECDAKTNMRSRTLTLKKGEPNCLPTRTMQKKCAKTCRYDKGAWSECTNGQMSRQDKLKASSSAAAAAPANSSCEPVRTLNKKCNPGGAGKSAGSKGGNKERKNKDKASRRGAQQQA